MNQWIPKLIVTFVLISIVVLGYNVITAKENMKDFKENKFNIITLENLNKDLDRILTVNSSSRNTKKINHYIVNYRQNLNLINAQSSKLDTVEDYLIIEKTKNISLKFKQKLELIEKLKISASDIKKQKKETDKLFVNYILNNKTPFKYKEFALNLYMTSISRELPKSNTVSIEQSEKTNNTDVEKHFQIIDSFNQLESLITQDTLLQRKVTLLNISYYIKSLRLHYESKATQVITDSYFIIAILFIIIFISSLLTLKLIYNIEKRNTNLKEIVNKKTSKLSELLKIEKDKANRDHLTGLHNRRYLFEKGEAMFAEAKKKSTPINVAMFDIDLFKNINDTYGHETGDVVIKDKATMLKKYFNEDNSIIARIGGEEFCVLQFGQNKKDFSTLLEKIRQNFENNEVTHLDETISYTVSIGYSTRPAKSLDEIISTSDDGLYVAKHGGRNKIRSVDE
ncbi:MAG: GGDEF domain-containing protein [Campylobacterota bacterium]|nr:GGDEF domain-containing protein [Campylobacterota bacterium]